MPREILTAGRWASRCRSGAGPAERFARLRRRRSSWARGRSRAGCSTRRRSSGWSPSTKPASANHADRLWCLLNLELWQRIFLDGEEPTPRSLEGSVLSHADPVGEDRRAVAAQHGRAAPQLPHHRRAGEAAPGHRADHPRARRRSRRPEGAAARTVSEVVSVPYAIPKAGTSRFARRSPGPGSRPIRWTSGSAASPAPAEQVAQRSRRQSTSSWRTSWSPRPTCPAAQSLPDRPVRAQRRVHDLEAPAARGERRWRGRCWPSSGARCAATRRARAGGPELTLAVSEADRACSRATHPAPTSGPSRPAWTPAISLRTASPRSRARLVFTGSMDWYPNEDGDRCISCEDMLPRLRRQAGPADGSRWWAGTRPTAPALGSPRKGVQVTGTVDDVRPHVAAAAVYVVPLRIGGGTRLKIFEALAMGKAVVSTTVGAEGLPLTPGEHYCRPTSRRTSRRRPLAAPRGRAARRGGPSARPGAELVVSSLFVGPRCPAIFDSGSGEAVDSHAQLAFSAWGTSAASLRPASHGAATMSSVVDVDRGQGGHGRRRPESPIVEPGLGELIARDGRAPGGCAPRPT